MAKLVPQVAWAQRRAVVFVTIELHDVQKDDVELLPNKVSFTGTMQGKEYAIEFEPYDEIEPEKSRIHKTDYHLELILAKKETNKAYWPRLLKEKGHRHWLKVDFNKWREDEDEDEDRKHFDNPFDPAKMGPEDDEPFSSDDEEDEDGPTGDAEKTPEA
eukprot:comp18844_c0_seq1/m.20859 comp18844_c0_seq1/g.20859  ORF comp18844_c0_seq1/g.20859 comp18844_c0_seq1/m.20859 type:complete len:159 (-) comp18844_c0_seq1:512-988(-)